MARADPKVRESKERKGSDLSKADADKTAAFSDHEERAKRNDAANGVGVPMQASRAISTLAE